jgi:transcriptional regulator with XRE-family HTH domain
LGLTIRELRRARGLTQEQLAERLNALTPNYARIEQGRQNVTVATLVPIARALDVSLEELFRSPRDRTRKHGRPTGS